MYRFRKIFSYIATFFLIANIYINVFIDAKASELVYPYEEWDIETTGSAKYLDGSTVFVCIFLNDISATWTVSEKKRVMDNMDIACDYLTFQGNIYGKKVNLIYDFTKDSGLCYDFNYRRTFPGNCSASSDDDVYELYEAIRAFIYEDIPSIEIMDRYDVDSIAYLVFIDGESDNAAAYSYYCNYSSYYEELALIPLRWTSGYEVNPDTYAHEILHLFGARDLYTTQERNGITKDFVKYVAREYPQDIMLGYATDGVSWEDHISSDISKITAYFLGWNGYIYELEEYPSIEVEYRASFTYKINPSGNYIDYTLKGRKTDEKTYMANILEIVCCIGIMIYFVLSIIKNVKNITHKSIDENIVYTDEKNPDDYHGFN